MGELQLFCQYLLFYVHVYQCGAVFEGLGVDEGDAAGEYDGLEGAAVLEGAGADSGDGVAYAVDGEPSRDGEAAVALADIANDGGGMGGVFDAEQQGLACAGADFVGCRRCVDKFEGGGECGVTCYNYLAWVVGDVVVPTDEAVAGVGGGGDDSNVRLAGGLGLDGGGAHGVVGRQGCDGIVWEFVEVGEAAPSG